MSADPKASDCVKVAIRVRPFISSEINRGCVQVVEKSHGLPQVYITGQTNSKVQEFYAYNNVFMPEKTQEEVYKDCVKPVINKLFDGYNVTILAYGQTGSGKTYTMGTCFEGNWSDASTGIIPRSLKDIFDTIRDKSDDTITATCNFMELYQENLYDLLSGKIKDQSVCEIREDAAKGIIINGLTDMPISDEKQAARYLIEGGENRTVGATAMNNVSSRSHAIFTVNFKIVNSNGTKTSSKFHLVDLAGSERSKKTQATGKRFKEGVKINQGLLALGNVISALGGGQGANSNGFISYRDSKLTRLLQDSLGGNSVTLMIACVSPADYNIEETLSTLRYADRAKRIKNKPVKNLDLHEQELERLKNMLKAMTRRVLFAEDQVQQLIGDEGLKALHATAAAECGENFELMPGTPVKKGCANKTIVHECGEACRKSKAEKEAENNELRMQISAILTTFHNMQHTRIIEEAFYAELIEKFEKLVDLLLKTCPAEFATPGTTIFQEIEDLTKSVDETIKKFKSHDNEMPNDEEFKIDGENSDDVEGNQRLAEYTQIQMKSLQEIRNLEQEMKIKQDLLNRKLENQPITEHTEKHIEDMKTKIQDLENELEELKNTNTTVTVRRDQNATKVNMDRKHKVEKLEKELSDLRKKCTCLEKAKKLGEADKKRIEDLIKQIQQLKTARIALVRQQRLESDQYQKYKRTRDKEVNILKEKSRKQENEMKRIERMHEKQQSVLKRKVEEAKSANRRLQEAMDRNKKVQEMRNNIKKSIDKPQEVIQNYMDHEIQVLVSAIDAKIAMQNLMNDRGLMVERLMNLKLLVNKTEQIEHEIKQIEEDLEMRNTQISDIRAKVMETDIEAKLKLIPDNFKTVPELRNAMGYILRALLDSREDSTDSKTKSEDLKMTYEAAEERIELMTEEIAKMKQSHEKALSEMENGFEAKLAYLNALNNKEELEEPDWDKKDKKENKKNQKWMMQQIVNKTFEINLLKSKVTDLEAEIQSLKSGRKPKKEKKQENNGTFTVGESDDDLLDSDDSEEDFNDSYNDPEWRKTPAHKRMKSRRTMTLLKESFTGRMDGTGMLANISESSENTSAKRSFNGQLRCKCKGSCATRLCKCKKNENFCSDNCQCSDACLNVPDQSKESDAGGPSGAVEKENGEASDAGDSPKRAKMDFNNITTPYYPYQTKKRKPLLQI